MAKIITLKKDENVEQLKKKLQSAQKNTGGIDAYKYSDTITLKEDPLKYQKRIRNEWN